MGKHFERASVLFEQRRYDLAAGELRAELAEEPDNAIAHAMLGICLCRTGHTTEALQATSAAIERTPDEPYALYSHGLALAALSRWRAAAAAIESSLAANPENPDALALLGYIRRNQCLLNEALQAVDRGLELDPVHQDCLNERAMILCDKGNAREAASAIQRSLALNPQNQSTHLSRGWILLENGDQRTALHHFREALRLDPNDEFAKAGLFQALVKRIQAKLFRFWLVLVGIAAVCTLASVLLKPEQVEFLFTSVLFAVFAVFLALVLLIGLVYQPILYWLMLFSAEGRGAFVPELWWLAIGVTGSLLLALGGAAVAIAADRGDVAMHCFFTWLLISPVAGTVQSPVGWPRRLMVLYTVCLIAIVAVNIGFRVTGGKQRDLGDVELVLFLSFVVGCIVARVIPAILRRLV